MQNNHITDEAIAEFIAKQIFIQALKDTLGVEAAEGFEKHLEEQEVAELNEESIPEKTTGIKIGSLNALLADDFEAEKELPEDHVTVEFEGMKVSGRVDNVHATLEHLIKLTESKG